MEKVSFGDKNLRVISIDCLRLWDWMRLLESVWGTRVLGQGFGYYNIQRLSRVVGFCKRNLEEGVGEV